MSGKVLIGWCDPGDVTGEFTVSMLAMMHYSQHRFAGFTRKRGGTYVHRYRNQIVREFLQRGDAEWLLQVDSDMTFKPDLLERLLEHADPETVPVLGALTFGWKPDSGPFPVMYRKVTSFTRDGEIIGHSFDPIYDYPKDELVQVGATGTGCLLIHRDVFATVKGDEPSPWFHQSVVPFLKGGTTEIGEDLTFCLRCALYDIPIHVHTGIGTGHIKAIEWSEATYRVEEAPASPEWIQEAETSRV